MQSLLVHTFCMSLKKFILGLVYFSTLMVGVWSISGFEKLGSFPLLLSIVQKWWIEVNYVY